ncbi:MexH family multidrug efflux RND transporter periplasmic adaptor subunit [Psychromonas marina]|uniref:MexH family multidrug efflux RND transporter periplasmic adaptor subunit n=1 Tax=Psychromonas marina TaxID=88364 RepID=A0ABQ6DZI1_9GAMM|nr:efflux RND transporter periplasmic adaptor subunit [Psychromonas marina]GLS90574.1 MexH family multidrug efflux RND transporter periplasmic adaptor subunit [Psychromonas marina]
MKKWIASALLLAILVFGSVIGFNMFKAQKIQEYLANRPIPEFPVTSIEIKTEDWTPHLRVIGFIEPKQGVTITNEVSGKIVKIDFESGQQLKKGDALVYLDSEVEKANLKASQGRLSSVDRNYKRMLSLFKNGSVSQGDVDSAEADLLALQGQIESYEATISRRIIRAPFDGIAGLRNVFMGEYLQDGTDIVRLEDISRMQIRFTIPQNDLNKIFIGQDLNIFVDAQADTSFQGTISAIEPAVNFQSGVIQVQADIPNQDHMLRSGMFAKANIILPTLENQITVTETAINYTLYGETVYVISDQKNEAGDAFKQVNQKIVELGKSKDGEIHVLSGLEAGDSVVTSGQVRLSNGAHVRLIESDILNKPAEIPAL